MKNKYIYICTFLIITILGVSFTKYFDNETSRKLISPLTEYKRISTPKDNITNKESGIDKIPITNLEHRVINEIANEDLNQVTGIAYTDPILFEQTFDTPPIETGNINSTLVKYGTFFKADFSRISKLHEGDTLDIGVNGILHSGSIKSKEKGLDTGNVFIEVAINTGFDGNFITIYNGQEVTKGKIFVSGESYIYEHGENGGFYMPLRDYKIKTNTFKID